MNHVFHKFIKNFILVYLDDILIFSKNKEEHVSHLAQVLQILRENQFYAKMSKCHFGKSELHYLRHVVGKEASRWILRKLRLWPSGIDLLKSDNYDHFWGFAITSADSYMDISLWLRL